MTPKQEFINKAAAFIKEHGSIGTEETHKLSDGTLLQGDELTQAILDAFDLSESI
jgi:hypothetical protein